MMDYDLLVIGGGIHGVGVAQAAAVKGHRVAVLEKGELAAGTSSKSSKLIHGGLRYLESAQFSLVKECLHERQVLLKIAPHLVNLKPFIIPIYQDTSRQATTLHLGLMLYGAFTGAHKSARYKKIPRRRWGELDGLKTDGLKHVFQYWDGQTDDVKLTRAVMQSAIDHGAELFSPARFIGAKRDPSGWHCEYQCGDSVRSIRSRVIVNAAGPWVNEVLNTIEDGHAAQAIDLVQGTHVIVNNPLSETIYYLEAPQDKRAVFVMPWYGKTMIGTTETLFSGSPDAVVPLDSEIDYLLAAAAHYFSHLKGIDKTGIDRAFAGLRVLPKAQGAAFNRPRETIYACDSEKAPRLLTIYGGKLTAYRATADRVLAMLSATLGEGKYQLDTQEVLLPETVKL